MKKIVIAVLALFSLGIAEAQITVHQAPQSKDIITLSGNTLTKFERVKGKFYYLLFLTHDKYDSYCIALGFEDEAKISLNQLLKNYKPEDFFRITDALKSSFYIRTNQGNGQKLYMIKEANSRGDYALLPLDDIAKFLQAINQQSTAK